MRELEHGDQVRVAGVARLLDRGGQLAQHRVGLDQRAHLERVARDASVVLRLGVRRGRPRECQRHPERGEPPRRGVRRELHVQTPSAPLPV